VEWGVFYFNDVYQCNESKYIKLFWREKIFVNLSVLVSRLSRLTFKKRFIMATAAKVEGKGWVYVFVCDPGDSESILGLYNESEDLNLIPTFRSKEEANDCFLSLPREKGKKYELQAIHIEELHADAEKNGFVVTMVDSDGKIIKD
jgi:hypothetical protein